MNEAVKIRPPKIAAAKKIVSMDYQLPLASAGDQREMGKVVPRPMKQARIAAAQRRQALKYITAGTPPAVPGKDIR